MKKYSSVKLKCHLHDVIDLNILLRLKEIELDCQQPGILLEQLFTNRNSIKKMTIKNHALFDVGRISMMPSLGTLIIRNSFIKETVTIFNNITNLQLFGGRRTTVAPIYLFPNLKTLVFNAGYSSISLQLGQLLHLESIHLLLGPKSILEGPFYFPGLKHAFLSFMEGVEGLEHLESIKKSIKLKTFSFDDWDCGEITNLVADGFPCLTHLSISKTIIDGSAVGDSPTLKYASFAQHTVDNLPDFLVKNPQLEILDIHTIISRDLQVLSLFKDYKPKLKVIQVKYYQGRVNELFIFPELQRIAIENAYELDLKKEFPKKVKRLHVEHFAGESFAGVTELVDLYELKLLNNVMGTCSHLDYLCTLKNLLKLDLSNGALVDASGIYNLAQLKYLNLSNNQLQTFQGSRLVQLDYLSLSNNNITSLGLSIPPNVYYLNLSHTLVTDLRMLNVIDLEFLVLEEVLITDLSCLLEFNPTVDIRFSNTVSKVKYHGTVEQFK
jgi:Leucine-rich repeat (LRR) protein